MVSTITLLQALGIELSIKIKDVTTVELNSKLARLAPRIILQELSSLFGVSINEHDMLPSFIRRSKIRKFCYMDMVKV